MTFIGRWNLRENLEKGKQKQQIYSKASPFMTTIFVNEAIQPTSSVQQTSDTAGASGKESCRLMVPKFVQPPIRTSMFVGSSHRSEFDNPQTRKRLRPREKCAPVTEQVTELLIDGDGETDLLQKFHEIASSGDLDYYTSIHLRRIRHSSFQCSSSFGERGKTRKERTFVDALRDLVEYRRRSWKQVKIHECSSWVAEVLLRDVHSRGVGDLQLVGIRDDMDDDTLTLDEGHHGVKTTGNASLESIIISFLQKSSRLKRLVIRGCNLQNETLRGMMHALCINSTHSKNLQELDLRYNRFTATAIQSILAIHLKSSLHSLRTIKVRQGIRCMFNRGMKNAIICGLRTNEVVLESIDLFEWDKLVQYFLDVNRAKRRAVFCNSDRLPRSLWPFILEYAVSIDRDEVICNDQEPSRIQRKSQRHSSLLLDRRVTVSTRRRQASVLYHMVRNGGPLLLEQRYYGNDSRLEDPSTRPSDCKQDSDLRVS